MVIIVITMTIIIVNTMTIANIIFIEDLAKPVGGGWVVIIVIIVLMLITTIIIIIMVRVLTPQVELQVVENLQAAQSLLFTAGNLL